MNSVKQLEYHAKFNVAFSDHLPVYAFFQIDSKKMQMNYDEKTLQNEYFKRMRFASIRMNDRDTNKL